MVSVKEMIKIIIYVKLNLEIRECVNVMLKVNLRVKVRVR